MRVSGQIISRGCSCGELGSLEVNGLRYGTRVLLWMRVDIQVLGLDYCGECRYGKVCLW